MMQLFAAEVRKQKRVHLIAVGYLGVLLSVILAATQAAAATGELPLEQFDSFCLYNEILLSLPFTLTLISGYVIDREYVQDTIKNLSVIPVRWRDIVRAKILIMFLLAICLGLFSGTLQLFVRMIHDHKTVTGPWLVQMIRDTLLAHVCVLIGILPVILLFSAVKGRYIWGSFLSLMLGISGIFCVNGRTMPFHPVTFVFSLISCDMIADLYKKPRTAWCSGIVYLLLAALIYAVKYRKQPQ
jgi:bacitracin transport system permease protein